jgi:predicted alpha/beta hydrolase
MGCPGLEDRCQGTERTPRRLCDHHSLPSAADIGQLGAGDGAINLGAPQLTHFGAVTANGLPILVLPALGAPARIYRGLADALATLGCSGAVLEWPGTGAHPLRASRDHDWGYRQLLEEQVLPAIAKLGRATDAAPQPVVLLAHSLGAHVALLARSRHANKMHSVIVIASGSPFYRVFKFPARQALLYLVAAVKLSTNLLGYFPGHRLGFAGREPRSLMREWARFAKTGILTVDGQSGLGGKPPEVENASSNRTAPVHALCLAGDVYAPREATVHLLSCAGIPATAIEQLSGPGMRGHFDWLRAPKVAVIAAFGINLARSIVDPHDRHYCFFVGGAISPSIAS